MDPLTFLVLVAVFTAATDWASGGIVRAEVGGGVRGSLVGMRDTWSEKNRTARKRRSKTRRGRFLNAIQDFLVGAFRGWLQGRRDAHDRRRTRRENDPAPITRIYRGIRNGLPIDIPDPEPEPELDPNVDPELVAPDPEQSPKPTPNGGPEQTPNGTPNEPEATPNVDPEQTPNEQVNGPNEDPEDHPEPEPEAAPLIPTQNTPSPTGETMSDFDNAPAYLAAWDDLRNGFENPEAELNAMEARVQSLADNGGDFHNGTEADALAAIAEARAAVQRAREAVDAAAAAAHDDLDASVEAASGKAAQAHGVMQEA